MQFSPSIYEHAAKLINRTPWEVSRNSDLLFQAHAEGFKRYRHSPMIVGIDIYNLEPEAYGAEINQPDGNGLPAISSHICESVEEILQLPAFNPATAGRIPLVIEAGKKLAAEFPEADVKIPVSGPFSIASNLMGVEQLLMDTFISPESVKNALQFLVEGQLLFCREVVSNGLEIAFFESSATPPLISPQMFDDVEFPALNQMITETAKFVGHPVPCIIGGDTAPILESIMKTGTQYVICPSETDQPLFMEKMKAYPDVMVRVNMDPGILVSGNMTSITKEVDRALELAATRKNACLGSGVLPYETESHIVEKIEKYIRENS